MVTHFLPSLPPSLLRRKEGKGREGEVRKEGKGREGKEGKERKGRKGGKEGKEGKEEGGAEGRRHGRKEQTGGKCRQCGEHAACGRQHASASWPVKEGRGRKKDEGR